MSTAFKNKNSLRTIEAQIVQKLKNNEARAKICWFLLKQSVCMDQLNIRQLWSKCMRVPYWLTTFTYQYDVGNFGTVVKTKFKCNPPIFAIARDQNKTHFQWFIWHNHFILYNFVGFAI